MAEDNHTASNQRRIPRIVGWLALGVLLSLWVYADYRLTLDSPLPIRQPMSFMVKKGQGIASISHELKQKRILAEPLWLRVLAYSRGVGQDIKYGEYEITPGTTQRGLLELLVSGKTRLVPVTVIEGWTFAQMRDALARHPSLRQETTGKTPDEIMTLLGAPGLFPEGQFFPDTYFTGKNTSDLDIFRQAHKKMRSVLESEWNSRMPDLPLNSPEEALTLASIVEKETGRASERPAIAGVFIRRLQKGMRLQTDPTVIYGMGEQFHGNLRKEDLRRDTPYNTYTRHGLPPTPIALPGRDAIHAALHPTEGTHLFFVARGDGTHTFSTTLEEHERAVDQFQRHR